MSLSLPTKSGYGNTFVDEREKNKIDAYIYLGFSEQIQKNSLKIKGKKLLNFEWESDTRDLPEELEPYKVKEYDLPFPTTVDEALAQVDGLKSLINPDVQAEGIVWWNTEGKAFEELGWRPNFKAINNSYL